MAKTVLLIRHGQTDWNASGRWQGHLPVGLNTVGSAQARALAEALADHTIDAVYSSDLLRAAQTAEAIARVQRMRVIHDPRWRELNVGVLQGLSEAEMIARYPQEFAALAADPMSYAVPSGELRLQLQARVHAAWADVVANPAASMAAIVSHGGSIRMLLLRLFPEQAEAITGNRVSNTSVTQLERNKDGWRIEYLFRVLATPERVPVDAQTF